MNDSVNCKESWNLDELWPSMTFSEWPRFKGQSQSFIRSVKPFNCLELRNDLWPCVFIQISDGFLSGIYLITNFFLPLSSLIFSQKQIFPVFIFWLSTSWIESWLRSCLWLAETWWRISVSQSVMIIWSIVRITGSLRFKPVWVHGIIRRTIVTIRVVSILPIEWGITIIATVRIHSRSIVCWLHWTI